MEDELLQKINSLEAKVSSQGGEIAVLENQLSDMEQNLSLIVTLLDALLNKETEGE